MFEHLKKEKPLPLKTRLKYLSIAAVGVAVAFGLSLWLLAQVVGLFIHPPRDPGPVPVHYDADGDGIPLNELDPVPEISPESLSSPEAETSTDIRKEESEKDSPPQ